MGRRGGNTGRTKQLTCQPRSSLFLQEANPRRSRAALPQRRRGGDKDETPPRPRRRRLQHRGQRPSCPAVLSTADRDASAPGTAPVAAPWRAAPAPRLWSEAEPAPTRTCKLLPLRGAAGSRGALPLPEPSLLSAPLRSAPALMPVPIYALGSFVGVRGVSV